MPSDHTVNCAIALVNKPRSTYRERCCRYVNLLGLAKMTQQNLEARILVSPDCPPIFSAVMFRESTQPPARLVVRSGTLSSHSSSKEQVKALAPHCISSLISFPLFPACWCLQTGECMQVHNSRPNAALLAATSSVGRALAQQNSQ